MAWISLDVLVANYGLCFLHKQANSQTALFLRGPLIEILSITRKCSCSRNVFDKVVLDGALKREVTNDNQKHC